MQKLKYKSFVLLLIDTDVFISEFQFPNIFGVAVQGFKLSYYKRAVSKITGFPQYRNLFYVP